MQRLYCKEKQLFCGNVPLFFSGGCGWKMKKVEISGFIAGLYPLTAVNNNIKPLFMWEYAAVYFWREEVNSF
jgi:hypothetical protein